MPDFVAVAGDQRGRPDFLRKQLEIHLVGRQGQGRRVVEHDHAAPQGGPAEQDAGHLGPGAPADVLGRIVAEHQHVEVVDRDPLGSGLRAADFVEIVVERLVFRLGRRAGAGAHVVVRIERQVARADQPRLVPTIDGRHRQPRRRVRGLFRFDLVDDKADFHGVRQVSVSQVSQGESESSVTVLITRPTRLTHVPKLQQLQELHSACAGRSIFFSAFGFPSIAAAAPAA